MDKELFTQKQSEEMFDQDQFFLQDSDKKFQNTNSRHNLEEYQQFRQKSLEEMLHQDQVLQQDSDKQYQNTNSIHNLALFQEYQAEVLQQNLKHINYTLQSQGFSSLGNLFSVQQKEIQQTINTIYELMEKNQMNSIQAQKQKEIARISETLNKNNYTDMIKLQNKIKKLEEIIMQQQQKMQLIKETSDEKMQIQSLKICSKKLSNELQKVSSQYYQMQLKDKQHQHEIKKKELEYCTLQDQLKKNSGVNINSYQNIQFEVSNLLEKNYYQHERASNCDEFQSLRAENRQLKDNLISIQCELNEMFQFKKDMQNQKRKFKLQPSSLDESLNQSYNDNNLLDFRKELFELPFEQGQQQGLKNLIENLKIFSELSNKYDEYDYQDSNYQNYVQGQKLKKIFFDYRNIIGDSSSTLLSMEDQFPTIHQNLDQLKENELILEQEYQYI